MTKDIVVSDDPNVNWNDDSLQFPRLLDELQAVHPNLITPELLESMDLEFSQVAELFERASTRWGRIKKLTGKTKPPRKST